jgi:2-C-methyl-D-erythritol 4-phosphate cytidylyltransferase
MDIPYIIVAGGKGLRMGTNIPKQYIEVLGKPIIYYTISNLSNAGVSRFIIVIDWQYHDYLEKVLKEIKADIKFVSGGKERYESVIKGLGCLDKDDEYVAIHDSVRPLVSKAIVDNLAKGIMNKDLSAVVPVLQVKDTVKIVKDEVVTKTLDRSSLRRIGTPQLLKVKDYLDAIENIGDRIISATDDASILEMNGNSVGVIEGEEEAFKITDSMDLALFEVLLRRQNENRNRL